MYLAPGLKLNCCQVCISRYSTGPPHTKSNVTEAVQPRHGDLMHYDAHRLNKGSTTGARGDKARTTVPTTNALTTSATGKVYHLSTQLPDDNRSLSLLLWSRGYWPGAHHLWVGSLLCAQTTGVWRAGHPGVAYQQCRTILTGVGTPSTRGLPVAKLCVHRTTVPTNTTLTTSATDKTNHLGTQPSDDDRHPSLLPWSRGYWPGTHHLWVGSLPCTQITGVTALSRCGPTVVALRVR